MIEIQVCNPYYDEAYTTTMTLGEWKGYLKNIEDGNIRFIQFHDELSNEYVTINPANFASVQVREVSP